MSTNLKLSLLIFSIFTFSAQQAQAGWFFKSNKREQIYIAGSSTISPLMTSVAEEFARNQSLKNHKVEVPLVESTGTTEGFRFFCQGVGPKYPDIVNASRPISHHEIEVCHTNNVNGIVEIKLGYDGIVIGNAAKARKISLTKEQIFLAIAEKVYDKKTKTIIANPYKTWNQIDSSLPKDEILVYAPPATSGTRDVFEELVMESSCLFKSEYIEAYPDFKTRKRQCVSVRQDDRFIEVGENDNFMIKHLSSDSKAIGIFGFNFLVANSRVVQAAEIDGIKPNAETIGSKKYPLSRPLAAYLKKEHLKLVPDLKAFVEEVISPETIGQKGYLRNNGLIAVDDFELREIRGNIELQLK